MPNNEIGPQSRLLTNEVRQQGRLLQHFAIALRPVRCRFGGLRARQHVQGNGFEHLRRRLGAAREMLEYEAALPTIATGQLEGKPAKLSWEGPVDEEDVHAVVTWRL
jgi:hypothetical protein